jgi:CheY-like chemotaxis protein
MAPRRTVLIVEDDTDLRRQFRDALAMDGFDVEEARSGFEALRRLDTMLPDIIVLDLMLPGVDGFMVRHELASHTRTRYIPIVVVTGTTENLDGLDVTCLLRKPVFPDRLIAVVKKCLASATTAIEPN